MTHYINMAAGEECEDYESWEEMEDAGVLDKKIEKLKAAMSTQKGLRSGISSDKSDTVVFLAEDGRTHYVPPEPTVKILKRPSVNSLHNAGGDGFIINGDNSGKPKQPIKTLQQREMEYAEARLRILGEAQSPEERPALLESGKIDKQNIATCYHALRIRRIQNKIESGPEPFEQNLSTPISNTINSTIMATTAGSTMINSMPMLMTSTQSQINITNNCGGVGGISVIASYGGSGGPFSHNINNQSPQYHQPNITGYSLLNHHYSNSYIHLNHYHHLANSSPLSQNFSSPSAASITPIATTSPNYFISSSPVSSNFAVRQPKGPDGTKGFNLRTLR